MLDDSFHFGRIDKSALDTGEVTTSCVEHITFTDELVGTFGIEHGTAVHNGLCAEGDTCRDIGFDSTRNYLDIRTLRSKNHVHSDGTRFLCETLNRPLDFLAGLHNEIAVLVDDDDEIRHIAVVQDFLGDHVLHGFLRIEDAGVEFLVVILDIAAVGIREQRITVLHFYDKGVEGVNDLLAIGDDDVAIFLVGHRCHIVLEERFVNRELNHLRVHEHELKFCRVLLI